MAIIRNESIEGLITLKAKTNTINFTHSDGTQRVQMHNTGATVTGTLSATTFSGSAASLTSIPAGNLTGTVADSLLSSVSASKLTGSIPNTVKVSDAQNNTIFGTNAGNSFTGTDANNNTLYGFDSGTDISSGDNNTFIGYQAGASGTNDITTGSNNTLLGYQAAASSASVSNEITIGNDSVTKFRIPGINVVLKDNGGTPSEGHVLTVDSTGEAAFAVGGVTQSVAIALSVAVG